MVNDRGTIKWTSLMLPEHVEMLKKLWNEDKTQTKPLLDEQELEQINLIMLEALESKFLVSITVFNRQISREYRGIITSINRNNHTLKLMGANGLLTIELVDVIEIEKI
ncbi:YolD-like family protein [Aquibacillus rhizosphaerae]|uniref:YolD-like family protein n=1 Tax=Aquibacillus rhizosphaerae TaxID=3051431 RepID=A0ABT7L1N2_9BACI|nr:YolD-like family protein [Aquibacillus sp. LR5S19]MDL4839717.1 YolD-like family protein [Aquibacillus sp. LR5S19]